MAMIPIYRTDEDRALLQVEQQAYEENHRFDINRSIRNRMMGKKAYYKLIHCLRNVHWRIKQDGFPNAIGAAL